MRIRFIIPGDIDTPTGGYRYDRAIINEWCKSGIDVELTSLRGSYPFPDEADRKKAFELISNLDTCDITVIDGLAGGCSPDLMKEIASRTPLVALIHHPLTLENGLSLNDAARLEKLEREGLEFTNAVVTTSPATTKTVHQLFGYPKDSIYTVMPGVERGQNIPFRDRHPLRILCVGSISQRKGHDILLSALACLKDHTWSLDLAGPTHFDPDLFQSLQDLVKDHGLDDRVHFHGAVDEKTLDALYQDADIFALASRYEGYGMVYAEAIVRGLPVIATTAGAIPDTVPATCGLLVPPDDIEALGDALQHLISDDAFRYKKHRGALDAEADFPTWESSANQFHTILRTLI